MHAGVDTEGKHHRVIAGEHTPFTANAQVGRGQPLDAGGTNGERTAVGVAVHPTAEPAGDIEAGRLTAG
jgi:hypothetical protein